MEIKTKIVSFDEIPGNSGLELFDSTDIHIDNEVAIKFEQNGVEVAFMSIMRNPLSDNSICINEFEVLKAFRRKGIGKNCIMLFLSEMNNYTIELHAKNKNSRKRYI